MRLFAVLFALAGVVVFTYYYARNGNGYAQLPETPTAVNCGDAAELAQKASDGRRQRDETNSDQEKIVASSRATFYASLATIADLQCKLSLPEIGEALKPAFEAARKAEATSSFYERAVWWGDASFLATQVVSMLMKQLPGQSLCF